MKNKFEIGDKVAVLDDTIEGVVVAVKNDQITLRNDDDFELTYFVNELVKLHVSNDLENVFSSKSVREVLKDKAVKNTHKVNTEKRSKKDDFVLEVDLHIEKLISSSKGLSNFDMLNIQMEEVKRKVEFCIKNRLPKLVLIHGVGEGVLKTEIEYFLNRYDNISFQEASFRKYGLGATEIYFKQNKI